MVGIVSDNQTSNIYDMFLMFFVATGGLQGGKDCTSNNRCSQTFDGIIEQYRNSFSQQQATANDHCEH